MTRKEFKRKDLRAHLNPDALLYNVKQLRGCCKKDVKFCAVVKANAYGHGIFEVVNILKSVDVQFFAVASIYEAFHICPFVEQQEILVFEPLYPGLGAEAIEQCAKLGIHCSISSKQGAEYVSSVLDDSPLKLKVHVNIDTGMGRCGMSPALAKELVQYINSSESMEIAGLYTHFSSADEKDLSFAEEQLSQFKKLLKELKEDISADVIIHAANSHATIRLPDSHFDMVRCGISVYGYSTIARPLPIELRPALKLTAPIVHLMTIQKGQSVSYGRTFIAKEKMKIAILPIGYSDGFFRLFSNQAKVKIHDTLASVIGIVTMNQIVIDVTSIADVKLGDTVTVIDDQVDSPAGVYSLAELSKTICYEILTSIPTWAEIQIANR